MVFKEGSAGAMRGDRASLWGLCGRSGDDGGGIDDGVVAAALEVFPEVAGEAEADDDEEWEGGGDGGGGGNVGDEGDDGDDEEVEVGEAAELVADGKGEEVDQRVLGGLDGVETVLEETGEGSDFARGGRRWGRREEGDAHGAVRWEFGSWRPRCGYENAGEDTWLCRDGKEVLLFAVAGFV